MFRSRGGLPKITKVTTVFKTGQKPSAFAPEHAKQTKNVSAEAKKSMSVKIWTVPESAGAPTMLMRRVPELPSISSSTYHSHHPQHHRESAALSPAR